MARTDPSREAALTPSAAQRGALDPIAPLKTPALAPKGSAAHSPTAVAGALVPASTQDDPPFIPGYRLFERLGSGGVGSVYRARALGGDATLSGFDVAIKVFPANQSWVPSEFLRETSALRRRHDHLVTLLSAGWTVDHRPFIVMEYVPGEDVRTRLSRGPIPLPEAIELMLDVFTGLDAMHRAGLVHGDVKPENVRIDGGRARLVDMGRTRLVRDEQPGEVFPGTRHYMRPSLFHGGQPDEQSDCFAAWVMCYELINYHRPFLPEDLARCADDDLPLRYELCVPELEELVEAGLSGWIDGARLSRVALERYLVDGVAEIPARQAARAISPEVMGQLRDAVKEMRSLALVGVQGEGAPLLERLERRWGGTTLRARPEWVSRRQPLAGALGLVVQASLVLPMPELLKMKEQIGPLGEVLAEVVPAARAWLDRRPGVSPTAAQVRLAILRMVEACPRPQLILVEGLDRMDSASRRMMTELALCPDVLVVGTSQTADHGLPSQIVVKEPEPVATRGVGRLTTADRTLLAQAAALELPMGPSLARAAGVELEAVARAARAAEACGLAAWDGVAVIPARVPIHAEDRRIWAREAAARLSARDGVVDPDEQLLVARYARIAGDTERLLSVLGAAAAHLAIFDPAQALDLLDHQPEPWDLAGLQRRFDLAIQARDVARAREMLERLRALAGPEGALGVDEAEMELLFQEGRVEEARRVAHRAMARIGQPLPEGDAQAAGADGVAFLRLLWRGWRLSRGPEPSTQRREGALIARLHDLHFLSDNRLMMHIHRRWVESSPGEWRARAMDVVWYSALGMRKTAVQVEERLLADARLEDAGPLAEAIVVAHRGIGRLLRGETRRAFSDGLDASRRLLRIGDSYCASLAATVVWAAGYHLGETQAMREVAQELSRVADLAHDGKARAWASGGSAVIAWLGGDLDEAIVQTEAWIRAADGRDSSGALALRFLGELYLDQGRPAQAIPCFERSTELMKRYNLVTDHCHAVYLSMGIADGQLRRLGKPPHFQRWWHGLLNASLLWRSPRWRPRALVAEAWQAKDKEAADALFLKAVEAARDLNHPRDEQWILEQHALMEQMDKEAAARRSA